MPNDALDPAQLPAGPELDAEVERVVFDKLVWACNDGTGDWLIRGADGEDYLIPAYSTSIEAAMMLAEYLGRYSIAKFDGDLRPYRVQCWGRTLGDRYAWAETLPLAICRAALSAVAMAPEDEQ